MTEPTAKRPAARRTALIMLAVLLSGCSSIGNMFGGSSSSSGASSDLLPAATATSQASATPATPPDFECPSVEIRSGASTLTITEAAARGSEGAPLALRYQGSIVRTARECIVNAGVVNLRVGIEGRIVLGPAGGPGEVHVPLRIAVVEEGANPKTIVTKLYRTVVVIPPDQGHSTFSYVAEDLSFPMPRGSAIEKYVIYLGFDPQAEPARPARPARRTRS